MKHKTSADYFIKYDNNAPTAWLTLLLLVVVVGVTFTNRLVDDFIEDSNIRIVEIAQAAEMNQEYIDAKMKIALVEENKQEFLGELRSCESSGNDFARGDSGASLGIYQWQKESLEDYLGRRITYDEYYSIATDFDKIHPITYDTYFVKGESWRWKNCTNKIMKQKTWIF